jgi:hypothetical protein
MGTPIRSTPSFHVAFEQRFLFERDLKSASSRIYLPCLLSKYDSCFAAAADPESQLLAS